MDTIFGHGRKPHFSQEQVDSRAKGLWDVYSAAVGGKAFNGDPLPAWEEFSVDPKKTQQADGYRAMAKHALFQEQACRDSAVVDSAVATLNRAFAEDPNAVHALVCNRVPVNDRLVADPTVVCELAGPVSGAAEFYQVGALGLLNGVIGDLTGGLSVAVQFSEPDAEGRSKIRGFQRYTPSKEKK